MTSRKEVIYNTQKHIYYTKIKLKKIPLGFKRAVDRQAAQRNTSTTQALFLISTMTVSVKLVQLLFLSEGNVCPKNQIA